MKYKWVVLGLIVLLVGGLWSRRDGVEVLGATSTDDCPLLRKGDLDCDGRISIADFAVWKFNYLLSKKEPTPTQSFGELPTSTPIPTEPSKLECKWCGSSCVSSSYGGACLDVMPPAGKSCLAMGGECKIVSDLMSPTPTLSFKIQPTSPPASTDGGSADY